MNHLIVTNGEENIKEDRFDSVQTEKFRSKNWVKRAVFPIGVFLQPKETPCSDHASCLLNWLVVPRRIRKWGCVGRLRLRVEMLSVPWAPLAMRWFSCSLCLVPASLCMAAQILHIFLKARTLSAGSIQPCKWKMSYFSIQIPFIFRLILSVSFYTPHARDLVN